MFQKRQLVLALACLSIILSAGCSSYFGPVLFQDVYFATTPESVVEARAQTRWDEYWASCLELLHQRKRAPNSNDWLVHHQEDGQTYQEYINSGSSRSSVRRL